MGSRTSSQSSQDIPVDPNRRPADEPKLGQQQQQGQQSGTPQMGADAHPYLPPMPRKYPEPTD